MLKKFLVMFLAANLFASSVAFAQYQPKEELTAEEVELYMSTLETKGNKVNPAIPIGIGSVVLISFAYAVKKIAKNPELGLKYVASQDPKAYSQLMKVAASRATKAEAGNIEKVAARELEKLNKNLAKKEAMNNYNIAMRHKKAIKGFRRGNYFDLTKSIMKFDKEGASSAVANIRRSNTLLANPRRNISLLGKRIRLPKGSTVAMVAIITYAVLGKDKYEDEEIEISNNRVQFENEVRQLMKEDPDKLALFIITQESYAQNIAYSVLAENPELFKLVKQQIEEAFNKDNIDEYLEFEALEENAVLTDSLRDGWSY